MGYFFENQNARWQLEFNAYKVEIKLVRELREFQIAKQLVRLARAEKATIFNRDDN